MIDYTNMQNYKYVKISKLVLDLVEYININIEDKESKENAFLLLQQIKVHCQKGLLRDETILIEQYE